MTFNDFGRQRSPKWVPKLLEARLENSLLGQFASIEYSEHVPRLYNTEIQFTGPESRIMDQIIILHYVYWGYGGIPVLTLLINY